VIPTNPELLFAVVATIATTWACVIAICWHAAD
jgi:hypothetical protein